MTIDAGRCALLLAHPGHELAVHRFVEETRPLVAILTDGSGASGHSRIDSTTRLLEPCGAVPLPLYARCTDGEVYAALLAGDADFFLAVAEELAEHLVAARIETVAGDAAEGWNPVHDIWRGVVNTAVVLAEARMGRAIRNFDFVLFGPQRPSSGAVLLNLDDASYRRKMDAGSLYSELHAEVHAALRGTTSELIASPELSAALDARLGGLSAASYRQEVLRPVDALAVADLEAPRVYELYGEMLVARGRYAVAIRHDRHLLPIETALRQHGHACASSSQTTT